MIPIIGLHGYAYTGKDTVAGMMVDLLPHATRMAFADPLKDGLSAMFAIPRGWFDDPDMKDKRLDVVGGITLRELMQQAGSEFARHLDPDCWVKVAAARVRGDTCENAMRPRPCIERKSERIAWRRPTPVFADVRKDNEAAWIQGRGGFVVHITRPGYGPTNAHDTEAGITPTLVDYRLHNAGNDLAQLRVAVYHLLGHMRWDYERRCGRPSVPMHPDLAPGGS